jgi:hypothetical protein
MQALPLTQTILPNFSFHPEKVTESKTDEMNIVIDMCPEGVIKWTLIDASLTNHKPAPWQTDQIRNNV